MNADTEQSDVPEEYTDVDPVLLPLFEIPGEWFQDSGEESYETALGPFGVVDNLSPEAVSFRARSTAHPDYIDEDYDVYESYKFLAGTRMVPTKEEAEKYDEPCLWVERQSPTVMYVFERVPFESRVTTSDELQDELSEIMDAEPEWESLFEEAYSVATDELGLSAGADQLTSDEYYTAYKVLEIGRDESDLLTDNEKALLNEAHCLIQKMEEHAGD